VYATLPFRASVTLLDWNTCTAQHSNLQLARPLASICLKASGTCSSSNIMLDISYCWIHAGPMIRQEQGSNNERRSTTEHKDASESNRRQQRCPRRRSGKAPCAPTPTGQNATAHFTASLRTLWRHSLAKGFICSLSERVLLLAHEKGIATGTHCWYRTLGKTYPSFTRYTSQPSCCHDSLRRTRCSRLSPPSELSDDTLCPISIKFAYCTSLNLRRYTPTLIFLQNRRKNLRYCSSIVG
jgi:hypothetical protein